MDVPQEAPRWSTRRRCSRRPRPRAHRRRRRRGTRPRDEKLRRGKHAAVGHGAEVSDGVRANASGRGGCLGGPQPPGIPHAAVADVLPAHAPDAAAESDASKPAWTPKRKLVTERVEGRPVVHSRKRTPRHGCPWWVPATSCRRRRRRRARDGQARWGKPTAVCRNIRPEHPAIGHGPIPTFEAGRGGCETS